MVNRLFLGDKKEAWLLADSENPKDLMENLARAAKEGTIVFVKARRASGGPELQVAINPSVIPFWFVDSMTRQKVTIY